MIKKTAILISTMFLTGWVGTTSAAPISAADIVTNWTAEADFFTTGQSGAWAVSGSAVNPGGNRTGAKVSNFSVAGDFSFSSTLRAIGDNDLMGLVFGWQDANNGYMLGWGGGGVGAANGIHLWRKVSGTRVDLATVSASLWSSGVDYRFDVGRVGNSINAMITRVNDNFIFYNSSVVDTSFNSGRVGLDVWSQNANFSATDITLNVPEPAILALFGLGLVGLGFSKRKKA